MILRQEDLDKIRAAITRVYEYRYGNQTQDEILQTQISELVEEIDTELSK